MVCRPFAFLREKDKRKKKITSDRSCLGDTDV